MGETDELFANVNYIKNKVEAIEKIELLNLRSNNTLRDEYVSILSSDVLVLKVYKALDGKRSQKEIAAIVDTTEMSVSRKIIKLLGLGLIELKKVSAKGENVYMHSIAERAFRLTSIIK